MRGVTFAYPGRAPVLRDFSLHIPAGQTVAVVGATGSGKSTLVKLLLRLYVMERGAVTEAGRHQELLEHGALYAALWRVQTGEAAPV